MSRSESTGKEKGGGRKRKKEIKKEGRLSHHFTSATVLLIRSIASWKKEGKKKEKKEKDAPKKAQGRLRTGHPLFLSFFRFPVSRSTEKEKKEKGGREKWKSSSLPLRGRLVLSVQSQK